MKKNTSSTPTVIMLAKADDKMLKLEKKLAEHQVKVEKAEAAVAKKKALITKITETYRKDAEACALIPLDVFVKTHYPTSAEVRAYNAEHNTRYSEYDMANAELTKAYNDMVLNLREKYSVNTGWTKENAKIFETRWNALESDTTYVTLLRIHDMYCKLREYTEGLYRKEYDLTRINERVIIIRDDVKKRKEQIKRTVDLFKQVPELQTFIDTVTEKQFKFKMEENAKLEKTWEKYNAAEAKLDKKYGDMWSARCNRRENPKAYELYVELEKKRPKRRPTSEQSIRRECDMWRINEMFLMQERVLADFGKVKSTTLNIGIDGNVNGYIVGEKKQAKIESIAAGGYNIQCWHTRLLVHEK